jgi:putative nucleotidyltransferase with HDIG domain
MNSRAKWYTAGVTLGALFCFVALYAMDQSIPANSLVPLIVLSALALVAELLGFLLPNAAVGSIGFIAFFATVLIVPSWPAVAAALIVRVLIDAFSRKTFLKALFNMSLFGITIGSAVLVFRLFGGESMARYSELPLAQTTLTIGVPFVLAIVTGFAANSILLSGVIAANSGRRFGQVWVETFRPTIGLDLLATPLVFLFAWVFVSWGPFAAAALWIPVLGLRQLQKNNIELARINSELLELMVKSMEARDPYTSGHSRRVQQFSLAIARSLGLPPAEVDKVNRASLLHDVGKIHEKYAPILRKPGKLSPEEWQTMQEHPSDGAELVSTMSRLHDIVPSIRHHHERWDGTGYPDGLAGETIPVVSRVIAFADTIDAMTSERPYRRTLSEEEVRAEIVRCRGTQFDPTIADQILSGPVWRLLFAPTPVDSAAVKSGLSLMMPARTAGVRKA